MSARAAFGLLAAALLAQACAVGPAYKRPAAPMPASYKEIAAPAAEEPAAVAPGQAPVQAPGQAPVQSPEQWKPAQPRDGALRGKWWEVFEDPELNVLEEQVLVSNQSLAQAEAQYRGARAAARVARADLFPTLGAAASASRSHPAPASSGAASGASTHYEAAADFSWEADLWGRIRRGVEAGVESAQASAADLENAKLSLQAQLADDYFTLHGVDAQERLLETTVAAYETALALTVNKYNQGIVSGVDVAQARTQLETTRAQATDLGVARAGLEHAIAVLVGKAPADFSIGPSPVGIEPPDIPAGIPSELLERRPDIAAAERRAAAANAQIGVAKAAFFPALTLAASGGYASSKLAGFFSLPNRFWTLGPALLAETIFQGGKRRAQAEQAEAAYDAAAAGYRETVLTALQQVEDNLAAARILDEEAAQQAEAVVAAERSLALAKNRYEGGITSYLEVITAQSTALSNERTAVELLTRRMVASVDLIKALGGGWGAEDLPTPRQVLSHGGASRDH